MNIAEPAERNLFLKAFRDFIRHSLAHADIDESGRDRVDGDVLPREFARRYFGERDDGSFAR